MCVGYHKVCDLSHSGICRGCIGFFSRNSARHKYQMLSAQETRLVMAFPHHESRRSNQAGVTLIELVLVVTIIGIVAAFAVPKIDYAKYRVDSSMRGIGTAILSAQRRAVSGQYDVIVTFTAGASAIQIHEDVNNNGAVDSDERTRGIPMGEQVIIGRGAAPAHAVGPGPITFTKRVAGVPAVTFHRNGSASEHGGLYLTTVRARSGGNLSDNRLIEIERSTGRVSWYIYRSGSWEREY